jgi:DNA invertase Pin-like site-specific DNA recombinase
MTGKRIGYIRVSTAEQNPDRQLEGISLDKKFIDYASGSTIARPQLELMLDYAREDDVVIVHSMDRLARNLRDLKNLVEGLVYRKIHVHFLKENLKFTNENSSMSNLMLNLMGSFAEFEYAFIKERQREGIEIAKRRGKYKGRPKKLDCEGIKNLWREIETTRKSKVQIAEEMGISRRTLYKYVKNAQLREKDGK